MTDDELRKKLAFLPKKPRLPKLYKKGNFTDYPALVERVEELEKTVDALVDLLRKK